MSVIVKGMDMPKSCLSCPFHEYGMIVEWILRCKITGREIGDFGDTEGAWNRERRADCPLEEADPIHRNPEDAYREDFGKETDHETN